MTNISDKQKPAALLVEQLARQFAPHERTVPAMLIRQAERFADRPLVRCGDAVWSYAQTRNEAARFGATLRAAGIQRGDRVALICSNRIEFLQAFLGCAWIGAVSVPINTASRGHQLQHILSNSAARLLFWKARWPVISTTSTSLHCRSRQSGLSTPPRRCARER